MMPIQTRNAIDRLWLDGYGPTQIARRLGLSVNTVKSYIQRHKKDDDHCPVCGKPMTRIPGHRKKKYCSDRCRSAFWNRQYRKGAPDGTEN